MILYENIIFDRPPPSFKDFGKNGGDGGGSMKEKEEREGGA